MRAAFCLRLLDRVRPVPPKSSSGVLFSRSEKSKY